MNPASEAERLPYGSRSTTASWSFNDIRLDALSIIAVLWFDGNFWTKTEVTYGIFIDERAAESQREAIQSVFSGRAGGFIAKLAGLIGEARRWMSMCQLPLKWPMTSRIGVPRFTARL